MARGRPDFSPTAVDVILRPEWAAVEATDKNLGAFGSSLAWEAGISVNYAVPAGKTLYITQLSGHSYAQAAADADLNQMMGIGITYGGPPVTLWYAGGNGGSGMAFPKPLVLSAGETMHLFGVSFANHEVSMDIVACGYER